MDENENKIGDFCKKYLGAIVGIVIAILIIVFGISNIIINLGIIIGCAFAGKYVQQNKASLKEKVKAFIDKLLEEI